MDRILWAKDFANTRGYKATRDWYLAQTRTGYDTPFVDCDPEGKPVASFVDFGRWIAQCECGGAEAIDPDAPFFYCLCCGNPENEGKPRPVILPEDWQAIERELLRRPVRMRGGRNAYERATMAEAAIVVEAGPLSRSWTPDESLEDLKRQNKAIKKAGK